MQTLNHCLIYLFNRVDISEQAYQYHANLPGILGVYNCGLLKDKNQSVFFMIMPC